MKAPQVCPSCGRDIDPLRAPLARISGGKIVTYCSNDCAAAGAPARAMTPAPIQIPTPTPLANPNRSAGSSGSGSDHGVRPVGASPTPAPAPAPAPRGDETALLPSRELAPYAASGDSSLGLSASRASGPRRVKIIAAAVGVIILAGAGLAILRAVSPGQPSDASATERAVSPVAPEPAPAAVPVRRDRAALAKEAHEVLAGYLGSTSSRVRVLAAVALSRTRDPKALEELRRGLIEDSSEIRRLEIATALARAGDAAGSAYLLTSLDSKRRDVRLQAARSFASLGDERGKERLREAMKLVTLRLGAAETLAILGDAEALAFLKNELATGGPEAKLRAAVALGRAGDATGLDLLKSMAAMPRIELGTATALARLGDPSAVPSLSRALGLTALRVEAAVALRKLGADVDLEPLANVLSSGDELSRITAAEALLILAGEAS